MQEYLAARYLIDAGRGRALDWNSLIDDPRWQETLLHAASIRASDLPAISVLEATYAEVESAYAAVSEETVRLTSARDQLKSDLAAIKPDSVTSVEGGEIENYGPEKTARREELSALIADKERELREVVFSVPSKVESGYADRVVLGSQLIREASRASEALGTQFAQRYSQAVNGWPSRGARRVRSRCSGRFGTLPRHPNDLI